MGGGGGGGGSARQRTVGLLVAARHCGPAPIVVLAIVRALPARTTLPSFLPSTSPSHPLQDDTPRMDDGLSEEQAIERYLPAPVLATVFEYLPQHEENQVGGPPTTPPCPRARLNPTPPPLPPPPTPGTTPSSSMTWT